MDISASKSAGLGLLDYTNQEKHHSHSWSGFPTPPVRLPTIQPQSHQLFVFSRSGEVAFASVDGTGSQLIGCSVFDPLVAPATLRQFRQAFTATINSRQEQALEILQSSGETSHSATLTPILADGVVQCVVAVTKPVGCTSSNYAAGSQSDNAAAFATNAVLDGSLAHELTNSLAAIANFAAVLRRTAPREFKDIEQLNTLVDSIESQAIIAARKLKAVRAMLMGSRSEIRQVDINRLLGTALEEVLTDADELNVETALQLAECLPLLDGDETQLVQLFANLLRNAIQAMESTPVDSRRLSVATSLSTDRHAVCVRIVDQGSGIDAEVGQSIHEPFFSSKANGLGLGLWICKSIVEAHGGALTLVPNDRLGSTATCLLPIAAGR